MLRLERITQNKIISLAAIYFFSLNVVGQVNNNQINQPKSPNSNAQIGNGNVNKNEVTNKNDNRKYYKTENKTQNENISYSGPLITGNNPFIIINNVAPNKDSINYEIQLKKRNIRISLSRFMLEGANFKKRCLITTDTSYTEQEKNVIQWNQTVFSYLLENLDESYARQFDLVEKNDALSFSGMTVKARNLYDFLRVRVTKLDEFISSLY